MKILTISDWVAVSASRVQHLIARFFARLLPDFRAGRQL